MESHAPVEEVKDLQRCMSDLVSVLALPAVWSGREADHILATFLDALSGMLNLDFLYCRVTLDAGQAPIESIRIAQSPDSPDHADQVYSFLSRQFGGDARQWPTEKREHLGDKEVFILPLRLGLDGEIGVVIAGSQQVDFPRQTDRLILTTAANQLAVRLQQARLLNEQKSIADELECRVAERTTRLAAANEELNKEIAERRRIEAALRESEQSFRLIVDGIAGLVAIMAANGATEVVNRKVLDYFGKTVEELKAWSTADSVHPEDLPATIKAWITSVEAGCVYDIDHRLRRADGQYRWFHARGLPLRDANGSVLRWYVLLTDIHDRKQAEEALLENEQKLRLIIDTIPTLAWSARPDGSADFFNQHYQDYTGMSASQAQDWGWTQAIHPDNLQELTDYWQTVMATGVGAEIEARLRRHDGAYRWFLFRANALRDESGKIVKWYGTNIDIDDRKNAEEQLRRSEAFLAEAQHLTRIGSFAWCVSTEEIRWSEQLYRIFQFDPGRLVTFAQIGERVHPNDLSLLADMIEKARRAVTDLEYEHRIVMPDGSIKHLHLTAHATHDQAGRLEYIGAVQDVTQRRFAEEALTLARQELDRVTRSTSLAMLTASIAHEVSQPLSGIVTNASTCMRMLDSNPPDIDGARETARRTIRDGNRASEVITRLRALFRKKEVVAESVDLNDAVREIIAMSLIELQKCRVILKDELADNLPQVRGDRIQLQQVILNLLRNALDAMTSVEDRSREMLVKTERHGEHSVRFSVKDTGVGFEPHLAEKLFEGFYTTKGEGMGIGLSVSRSIIEAHQGHLCAALNEGPGATFAFSIPCDTATGADEANDMPGARDSS